MTWPLQKAASTRGVVALVFAVIAATYVIPIFVPDPSIAWASEDEICCHIPSIQAIQREGVRAGVTDYAHYRSATAPLYHLLMALVLGRVAAMWIRLAWIAVAFAAALLLYHHVRTDPRLTSGHRAALALALAFLLSPTARAAAVYFVTDGLAVQLAIAALVLLRRARAGLTVSLLFGLMAIVAAYASFYTRQFYLWTPLYVAHSVVSDVASRRARIVAIAACLLLAVPGAILFTLWRSFTTPLDFEVHTQPVLLSTVPNALGLLALYSLPLAWIAVRDTARNLYRPMSAPKILVVMLVLGGGVLYVGTAMALGFEVPESGGILRAVRVAGSFGIVLFLVISYLGLVMLLRWLVVDGLRQLWWAVFLLPLFAGSIVLQRYVEPAILVFMFLVARPADALKVLDSRLVWFYPLFTAVYALSRTILFASIV